MVNGYRGSPGSQNNATIMLVHSNQESIARAAQVRNGDVMVRPSSIQQTSVKEENTGRLCCKDNFLRYISVSQDFL